MLEQCTVTARHEIIQAMKLLMALCLGSFSFALSAQTTTGIFVNPDGDFQFRYSTMLVDCMAARGDGGPGSRGTSIACFAYPGDRFKHISDFGGAIFYVSEIQSAKTENICLKGSPDWYVISSNARTITINHVVFKTFTIGDNWMSGGQSGPAYRTFHSGKCYELGIQTFISRGAYDPGTIKPLTKKQWSSVNRRMKEPLNSFVFLK
jgi:hypothetical protein